MTDENKEPEKEEADPIETLTEELNTLQSDTIFTAFAQIGKDCFKFGPNGEATYDRTRHIFVFETLVSSFDQYQKEQEEKQEQEEGEGE